MPRFVYFVACAYLLANDGSSVGDEPISAETIEKAWKRRNDQVKSVRIDYEARTLYPKDSIRGLNENYPPKDTVTNAKHWVAFQDDKVRIGYQRLLWSSEKREFVPERFDSAFDGEKVCSVVSSDTLPQAQGKIEPLSQYLERKSPAVALLAIHFRPLDARHHDFDLKRATIHRESEKVGSVSCVVLQWDDAKRKSIQLVYLDPRRQFSVVGGQRLINGTIMDRAEWKLAEDAECGYVPSTMEFTYRSNGVNLKKECKVACKVNLQLAKTEFQIEFPRGTIGFDEIGRKQFKIPLDNPKENITPKRP
jgi:hypothetical protein